MSTESGCPSGSGEGPKGREFLQRLMNNQVKITVNDGRVFYGYLFCVDHQSNLILVDVKEVQPLHEHLMDRNLGMILISENIITKIECRPDTLTKPLVENKTAKLEMEDACNLSIEGTQVTSG